MDIKRDVEIRDLLPLGSVVTLKDSNQEYRFMITAYFPKKEKYQVLADVTGETCAIYDYLAISWVEIPDDNNKVLFNHDRIEKVLFRGYVNEESNAIKDMFEKHFNSNNIEQGD